MRRLEMKIALDAEAIGEPYRREFGGREAAQLRTAEPQIGEAEQDAIRVDLGCKPGRGADGIEEAHHGFRVGFARAAFERIEPGAGVGREAGGDFGGEQFHAAIPSICTSTLAPQRTGVATASAAASGRKARR